jgi:hypothetical protein
VAKKCKHCGASVEDTAKICSKCNNFGFEEVAKVELSSGQIQEIAQAVSENISKRSGVLWGVTWRVFLGLFALLGIPGAITGWNLWNSLHSFERSTTQQIQSEFKLLNQSSSNQIVRAHSEITNEVSLTFGLYKLEASNQIISAYSAVTNQIKEELATPRVKQTVESVAKGEAKAILELEVRPAVNNFREDALFIRTIARAQAYDFKAYQRLLEIGTQTNEDAKLATQVVAEIDRSLETARANPVVRTYALSHGTNRYPGPFASDEVAFRFTSMIRNSITPNREGFVNTVRGFNQPLFLSRLIEFFTNETDLVVADRLTMAISDLAKEDFRPHDCQQIQMWWRSHSAEYTNWPFKEFDRGLEEIQRGDIPGAAKSFHQVLDIDASADMSRALAIKCYWEIGETNKSVKLVTGFKEATEHWAQWASAMIELETGSASNATVKFVDLQKSKPWMLILPQKGTAFWRKLDWTVFDKLTATEKP